MAEPAARRGLPILYLDAIHLKLRTSGAVQNQAVYVALGINLEGRKDLLGLWVGESEGAKFWLNVLTELKNRGVRDILIACVDCSSPTRRRSAKWSTPPTRSSRSMPRCAR